MTVDTGSPDRGRRWLTELLRPHRATLALAVTIALVWTAARTFVPFAVGRAIDRGVTARDHSELWHWTAIVAGLAIVAAIAAGLRRELAYRVSLRVESSLRCALQEHHQRLHFAFHDRTTPGDMVSRMAVDISSVHNAVVLVPLAVANVVTVPLAVAILAGLNMWLTLLALVPIAVSIVASRRVAARLAPANYEAQVRRAELATVAEESLGGLDVLRGFHATERRVEAFADRARSVRDAELDVARLVATFQPLVNAIQAGGAALLFGVAGALAAKRSISPGALVSFLAYSGYLTAPVQQLFGMVPQAQLARGGARRLMDVFAIEPEIVEPSSPVHLPARSPKRRGAAQVGAAQVGAAQVCFDNVSFAYEPAPATPPVLHGIDLVVEPGETVAIVGPAGSGKSTIAELMVRLYDVTEGAVRIDGVDVRNLRLDELRSAVRIAFQESFLFADTVTENIRLAVPKASPAEVERAARVAGAHEFIGHLPAGYDTRLGEGGRRLSGGQRQRIALARALCGDPRVLILDDATSAVDVATERSIAEALWKQRPDQTTILIAHRPATIELADRILYLDRGRLVRTGSHRELWETEAGYRRVLGADDDGRAVTTRATPEGSGG